MIDLVVQAHQAPLEAKRSSAEQSLLQSRLEGSKESLQGSGGLPEFSHGDTKEDGEDSRKPEMTEATALYHFLSLAHQFATHLNVHHADKIILVRFIFCYSL
tara:strand:+ start:213 stop:518 length:306 start_codon:yes stop_codon:yes gene_type:complete